MTEVPEYVLSRRHKRITVKVPTLNGELKDLTYETDLNVRVGDTVMLPAFPWQGITAHNFGVVVSLEGYYQGECSKVISVVSVEYDTSPLPLY